LSGELELSTTANLIPEATAQAQKIRTDLEDPANS